MGPLVKRRGSPPPRSLTGTPGGCLVPFPSPWLPTNFQGRLVHQTEKSNSFAVLSIREGAKHCPLGRSVRGIIWSNNKGNEKNNKSPGKVANKKSPGRLWQQSPPGGREWPGRGPSTCRLPRHPKVKNKSKYLPGRQHSHLSPIRYPRSNDARMGENISRCFFEHDNQANELQ